MILCASLCSFGAHALSLNDTFIRQHCVDENLSRLLHEHDDELAELIKKAHNTAAKKKHGVWKLDWLPGYYVKYDVNRLKQRELLAQCIEKHKLTFLHAPKKQLYHLKARPKKLNNLNYALICEEVVVDKAAYSKPLGLDIMKQFTRLIEETGHISTYAGNYIHCIDNTISFIDTDGTFDKNRSIVGLVRLLSKDVDSYYTPEALDHILSRIAHHIVRVYKLRKLEAWRVFNELMSDQKPAVAERVRSQLFGHIRKAEGR